MIIDSRYWLTGSLDRLMKSNPGASFPPDGAQPTYCLIDDDRLVQRLSVDARPGFDSTASVDEALVIVTAAIVLGSNASLKAPVATMFLVL